MRKHNVYIVLTDTGSLLTKMIKLYTKKRYNHASVSFDSHLTEVYSFGRKKMNNPFSGGFVQEDVKSGLFKEADCAIYSLTVTEEDLQKMRNYIKQMDEQKDIYRYNFLGLFGFLLHKPLRKENSYFCSEFVATVLSVCIGVRFHKPAALIAPSDLQEIPNIQLVYEGKLKDYQHNGVTVAQTNPSHLVPVGM